MKFRNTLQSINRSLCLILGTCFGIGCIPKASGTFASIAIAFFWIALPDYYFYNPIELSIFFDSYLLLLLCLLILSYISVYICKYCEQQYGHDAKEIVIDEVIGFLFAVLFLPKTIMVSIYALIFFRIFDIAKPLYINRLQNLPHGWGIVSDDIAAGLTTNIILQIIYRIKPEFFL